MGDLQKLSFQLFKEYSDAIVPYFPDLKADLKRAEMPLTVQEFISMSMTVSLISLIVMLPVLSFVFGLLLSDFLFGFLLSTLVSLIVTMGVFFALPQYPKLVIQGKSKEIDDALPFATMYLSTISSSNLPLHKSFDVFTKFLKYGEVVKQINSINEDIKLFGLDVATALERAIERSPSKKFREMLYGMLSTLKSGANMNIYLKEKSEAYMADYRRSLYEFSHALTVYVEIYLTSIVLGAIFFTVLTAIVSGISGGGENIIMLQFTLIFLFMPIISAAFIMMIKSATPGGE
ncbi:MAG: type II secretion system F family protein [Candidatus Aenigmarchaeota archaeon]|nr:type II secretion system F family protein [Candidatus Aenigmarchaeota archaeon]